MNPEVPGPASGEEKRMVSECLPAVATVRDRAKGMIQMGVSESGSIWAEKECERVSAVRDLFVRYVRCGDPADLRRLPIALREHARQRRDARVYVARMPRWYSPRFGGVPVDRDLKTRYQWAFTKLASLILSGFDCWHRDIPRDIDPKVWVPMVLKYNLTECYDGDVRVFPVTTGHPPLHLGFMMWIWYRPVKADQYGTWRVSNIPRWGRFERQAERTKDNPRGLKSPSDPWLLMRGESRILPVFR